MAPVRQTWGHLQGQVHGLHVQTGSYEELLLLSDKVVDCHDAIVDLLHHDSMYTDTASFVSFSPKV